MLRFMFEDRTAAIALALADGASVWLYRRVRLVTGAALRALALPSLGAAHFTLCSVQDALDRGALV